MSFIEELAPYAIKHGRASNVLPSLIVAQGILESAWGESVLAVQANNLFGIKVGAGWEGEVHRKRTAEHKANGEVYYIYADFRAYPTLEGCVKDLCHKYTHGTGWESHNRYAAVIGERGYKRATAAVKAAGYATDVEYPTKLNRIIEQYDLTQYDGERDMMYKFERISNLTDARTTLPHHSWETYDNHGIASKKYIAIHHSLTKTGSAKAYAKYHVEYHGWPAIAYHFVIEQDGEIVWCHDPGILSYHVGDSNLQSLGICLTGDFRTQEPTAAQEASLRLLVTALKQDLPNYTDTLGHNELPGYSWKQCPCFDFRAVLDHKVLPINDISNKDGNEIEYWASILETESGTWAYKKLCAFFNVQGSKEINTNQFDYLKSLIEIGGGGARWAEQYIDGYLNVNQVQYLASLINSDNAGKKSWALSELPKYL
ncbi:glucosaminidase domain-containing protein [Aureibacillus halotolerans]|uniref:Autolysin n=1 Tax=Aureibacillus halotolerans TaxID=1508390 RepID=A0A4R6TQS0_9BACI|nr:glucosaminidase domain-containing protein [Aureibacillus halotolerans]TDQ35301.1 flagellum-specific peptidoglycan hydrolase FlgJ [Aureibacillus halotolerans]